MLTKMLKGGAPFKVHQMYRGNKSVTADTHDEHLALGKKGYGHDKPGPPRCWDGYMPNPDGRPAKEQGSCVEKK